MKNKLIIAIISAFSLLIVIILLNFDIKTRGENSSTNNLSSDEKLADFEYMYSVIEHNHPFIKVNTRLTGIDWLRNKQMYIKKIEKTKNDTQFFHCLQECLYDLNNGHTSMVNNFQYFYWKKYYTKNINSYRPWLDELNNKKSMERYTQEKKLKDMTNTKETKNVVTLLVPNKKAAYISINSFSLYNLQNDQRIINPFFKEIKNYNTLIIDIRGNTGGDISYWRDYIIPWVSSSKLCYTQYMLYRFGNFTKPIIKYEHQIGELTLSPISKICDEKLLNIPPEVSSDFKYYSKSELVTFPNSTTDFSGKIYLLVDKKVFSAAEAFAIFAKKNRLATLVGEKTGGDGICYEPVFCSLPNSGYIFRFPKEMGLTEDGYCNFEFPTIPDIAITAKKNPQILNDFAVNYILNR